MVDLRFALEERGVEAVHFKTDSVKVANYKDEDIEFIREFGKKYGYTFSIEGVYEKMALINDAVLVGKWEEGVWTVVGARFAQPFVFKKLFSKEHVVFEDFIEHRAVRQGIMYLNMNEKQPDKDNLVFVGKVGAFVPIKTGLGGGELLRIKDGKKYAVTGTKGFRWLPVKMVEKNEKEKIDQTYALKALENAIDELSKFGDLTSFLD